MLQGIWRLYWAPQDIVYNKLSSSMCSVFVSMSFAFFALSCDWNLSKRNKWLRKRFFISRKIYHIASYGHFTLDITCNSPAKEAWKLDIGYILTIYNQNNVSKKAVSGIKIDYITVFSLYLAFNIYHCIWKEKGNILLDISIFDFGHDWMSFLFDMIL